MSRSITLDRARLEANCRSLQAALNQHLTKDRRVVQAATKDAAIWAARELARVTFPNRFGFVKARGQMRHDVGQVYATPGKAYEAIIKTRGPGPALEFYHAFKSHDFSTAQRILDNSRCSLSGVPCGRLDPTRHDAARTGSRGRVAVERPLQIVPAEDLAAYMPKAIARLGKTASGWSAVAEKLGSPPQTGFKSTAVHGSDGGSIRTQTEEKHPGYVLTNTRPLARGRHLSPGQIRRVIQDATLFMLGILRRKTSRRRSANS